MSRGPIHVPRSDETVAIRLHDRRNRRCGNRGRGHCVGDEIRARRPYDALRNKSRCRPGKCRAHPVVHTGTRPPGVFFLLSSDQRSSVRGSVSSLGCRVGHRTLADRLGDTRPDCRADPQSLSGSVSRGGGRTAQLPAPTRQRRPVRRSFVLVSRFALGVFGAVGYRAPTAAFVDWEERPRPGAPLPGPFLNAVSCSGSEHEQLLSAATGGLEQAHHRSARA
jgi:hypothetical protein